MVYCILSHLFKLNFNYNNKVGILQAERGGGRGEKERAGKRGGERERGKKGRERETDRQTELVYNVLGPCSSDY